MINPVPPPLELARQSPVLTHPGGTLASVITGAHLLLFSKDPEADRAFLRDILRLRSLDIGHGWLIFELPPAEAAVHPSNGEFTQRHGGHSIMAAVLYLMCDDWQSTMDSLKSSGASCTPVERERWGIKTTIHLPSGADLGLYQPTHPNFISSTEG